MTEISYAHIKSLAVLRAARAPVIYPLSWVFTGTSTAPSSESDGIDTEGALFSWVGVRLQKTGQRRALLRLDDLDLAQFYGPTFLPSQKAREAVLVQGAASHAFTLSALAAALLAHDDFDGQAQLLDETSILEFSDDTPWAYRLDGAEDGDGNVQALAPNQSLVCEASQCIWRPWGYFEELGVWAPLTPPQTANTPVSLVQLPTAGLSRIYVQVLHADGSVLPLAGPCLVEGMEDVRLADAKTKMAQAEVDFLDFPTGLRGALPEALEGTNAEPVSESGSTDHSTFFGCEGLASATVHILPTDNVTSYTVQLVSFDGYGWAYVPNGTFASQTGPFAQTFECQGLTGIQALVQGVLEADGAQPHRFERRWTGRA